MLAAQTLAVESYARAEELTLARDKADILQLAAVTGDITQMTMSDVTVSKLVYVSAGGIEVTYENGKYTAAAKAGMRSQLSSLAAWCSGKTYGNIREWNTSGGGIVSVGVDLPRRIQQSWLNEIGGPRKLSDDALKELFGDTPYGNNDYYLRLMGVTTKDGQIQPVFYVTNSKTLTSNKYADLSSVAILYNNKTYVFQNNKGVITPTQRGKGGEWMLSSLGSCTSYDTVEDWLNDKILKDGTKNGFVELA